MSQSRTSSLFIFLHVFIVWCMKMMLHSIFVSNIIQKQNFQLFTWNYTRYLSVFTNFNSSKQNVVRNNLKFVNDIKFHTNIHVNQKLRLETENRHVYNLLQSLPMYKNNMAASISEEKKEITNETAFDELLNKNYRTETATVIVNVFKDACHFAKVNNITLSDTRFNKLVDGLMDKCQDLTDDELSELLLCINNYPKPETPASHNFHDIWSALDDMCCARIQNWSVQKSLLFADYWYLLGLSKYCDYSIQAIKKSCRKIKHLTPSELVQSLFYINISRTQWSMFEFESRLEEVISELSLSEMAVVSMAFFKTKTAFKGTFVTSHMLEKLLANTSTIHEITLTTILKVVRYSPHIPLSDQIMELLNRLVPEINRLSILCCLHISLLGTNIQLFHREILTTICEKIVKNITSVRLKDLERFTFTLTLFNFNPKTSPNIFESVLAELLKPERENEISIYARCLPCCVHYLGLQQLYSYELINKVLDPEFISKTYGKNKQSIGREIIFLDASVEIDCPDYKGNRLNHNLRKSLSKWTSHWIPSRDKKYRLTAADKLMLDIVDTLEVILGNNNHLHIDYLLPHFPKPDIILCKDKSGSSIEVKKYFEKYKLGDVMKPELTDGLKWYAVVVGSWNMFIRGTEIPVGTVATKLRQLEQIGYVPVLVPWSIFLRLSRQEKEEYIRNKIT